MSIFDCRWPRRPSTLRNWLVGIGGWMVLLGLISLCMACCTGCATPGRAGFREMRRQNVQEKRVLRAVAVTTKSIHAHAHAALADAASLRRTHLDTAQTKLVDDLTRQLMGVEKDKDDLTKQVLGLNTVVAQRDATIHQTQTEVAEAVRAAWWEKYRYAVYGFFIGLFGGAIIVWLLRATIHAALVGAAVYCPPLAVLTRKSTT